MPISNASWPKRSTQEKNDERREIPGDYQNGIFSGEGNIIAEVTGQPPMTVQQFVTLYRDAFKAGSTAG